jgi:hypothetical protein
MPEERLRLDWPLQALAPVIALDDRLVDAQHHPAAVRFTVIRASRNSPRMAMSVSVPFVPGK